MKHLAFTLLFLLTCAISGFSQYKISGNVTITDTNGPAEKNFGFRIWTSNSEYFDYKKTSVLNPTVFIIDTLSYWPVFSIDIKEQDISIKSFAPDLFIDMGFRDTTITDSAIITTTYNNKVRTIKVSYTLNVKLYDIETNGTTFTCGDFIFLKLSHSPNGIYCLQTKLKNDQAWTDLYWLMYWTDSKDLVLSKSEFPSNYINKEIQVRIKYYYEREVYSNFIDGIYFIDVSKTQVIYTPPSCSESDDAAFIITPPTTEKNDSLIGYKATIQKYIYTDKPGTTKPQIKIKEDVYELLDQITTEISIKNKPFYINNNTLDSLGIKDFKLTEGLYRF